MPDFVLDSSDTAASTYVWETRHNDNGKKGVKFRQAVVIFLLCSPLRNILWALSGLLETGHPVIESSRLKRTGRVLRITPFLKGERFDPETRRILGLALEMSCIALRVGDCADDVKQAIANKIIALAKAGERNPDVICEQVLKDIRRPDIEGARPPNPPFNQRRISTQ